MPISFSGLAKGSVAINGHPATSTVLRVGELVKGTIKLEKLDPKVRCITVGFTESCILKREVSFGGGYMDGAAGAFGPSLLNDEKDFKSVESVFSTGFDADVKSVDKVPTEGNPLFIPFEIRIPKKALPTMEREESLIRTGSEYSKTTRLVVKILCHMVVLVHRVDKPYFKMVGHSAVTLISTHLGHHLSKFNHKGDSGLVEFESPTGNGCCLRLNSSKLELGKRISFSLHMQTPAAASVFLCERVACTEEAAEHDLDMNTLKKTATLWAPVVAEGKGFPPELDHPKDIPDGVHGPPTWYIDRVATSAKLAVEKVEKSGHDTTYSCTIPADGSFQSTFSNSNVYHYWMLVVQMQNQELRFGPLPVVWADDTDLTLIHEPKASHEGCSMI